MINIEDMAASNENEKLLQEWSELDCDSVDFDELESKLESELNEQMADLKELEKDREKIGNPDSLGNTVMNVVWEQFINQVGVIAGEDFIKENRGLTLDLRDEAHTQTTENFANGKIATHNNKIDYQERYDKWQSKLQHDENGNVVTHTTRSGKQEANLANGARDPFDSGRPKGSAEKGTDMDHVISAGEIIRDPAANAHLSEQEQIDFANSSANLNEMDASQNRSKGDKSMSDWLDLPNANGQKPNEIFDINEEQDKQYREKDAKARKEYDKLKKEGEKRSIETGKQSQKEEAFRIGGKALRSVVMGLLASLIKDVIRKLISWFRAGNRKLNTFIESVKEAIHSFITNIKERLLNAGNTFVTTIATAIFGPVIGMIKKAWIFLKQGYNSVKQAIQFLKNPANKDMPFSIKMMEVGKIVIVGLTAGSAIVLSEVIEKGLMAIPGFGFQIPLLGSLANILGMFLGALTSGIIGALALWLIDKSISNTLREINTGEQIDKQNVILKTQSTQITVAGKKVEQTCENVLSSMERRHNEAAEIVEEAITNIQDNSEKINLNKNDVDITIEPNTENTKKLENLFNDIKSMK